MPEQTLIRLIALIGALAFVGAWLLARVFVNRRKKRFFALAKAVGGLPEAPSEFLYRCEVSIEGRPFEVRCQHIGGGGQDGSNWTPDWYLVTSTTLRGVSDVLSADVRPRSTRALRAPTPTADDFVVRDAGYPLPSAWLTPAVARALRELYTSGLPLEALSIESGSLLHRSRSLLHRLEAPALRDLLLRQAAVASAIERAV